MEKIEYEITIEGSGLKPIKVSWDGKKITSSNEAFLSSLKKMSIRGTTFKDGREFMEALPHRFNNGYVHTKKVKS